LSQRILDDLEGNVTSAVIERDKTGSGERLTDGGKKRVTLAIR
jgi:hypothetical protein